MKKKEIEFRDPVVERVVDKFVSRSDVGYAKYGQTLDKERKIKQKDLAWLSYRYSRRTNGCNTIYPSCTRRASRFKRRSIIETHECYRAKWK
jgi:hypothetical protein